MKMKRFRRSVVSVVVFIGVFLCLILNGRVGASELLFVDSLSPDPVLSSLLLAGTMYIFEVRGDYGINGPGPRCDAEWIQTVRGSWDNPVEYYPPNSDGIPPSMHELLVNGLDLDWEGTTDGVSFAAHTFSPSHVYRLSWVGTGDPVDFRILDTFYSDNVGSLTVEISPAPVPVPATMLLLGSGLVGLAGFRKRFRKS